MCTREGCEYGIEIDEDHRVVHLGEFTKIPFYAIKKLASAITIIEEERDGFEVPDKG